MGRPALDALGELTVQAAERRIAEPVFQHGQRSQRLLGILPAVGVQGKVPKSHFLGISRMARMSLGDRREKRHGLLFALDANAVDLDLTGQWPLWGNWYGVGRYNRNLRDHRLTQGIAGVEYNAGCWVFRGVVQHLTTSTNDVSRSFFFQLGSGRVM